MSFPAPVFLAKARYHYELVCIGFDAENNERMMWSNLLEWVEIESDAPRKHSPKENT